MSSHVKHVQRLRRVSICLKCEEGSVTTEGSAICEPCRTELRKNVERWKTEKGNTKE